MTRWEDERNSADKLRTRGEHLESAKASAPSLLNIISQELDKKGIGVKGK